MRDVSASYPPEPGLYRLIFEHAADAIAVLDANGRVRERNEAARALEVDLDALLVGTVDGVGLAELRSELVARGHASTELKLIDPAHKVRHIAVEGRAQGTHFVLVLRDVTAQRRIDDEIRHLRRVESLGYMAAAVAHDFNNLLVPIVFSGAMLAGEVDEGSTAASLVGDIRSAAERAAALVRHMLAFARRQSLPPQRVNLGLVLDELRGLVDRVVGEGIAVAVEVDAELGDAILDREQLEHVILNLAANARDAMPRGGKLTIRAANLTLDDVEAAAHECPAGGAYVVLTVADTGAGMSPEVRERIFERFFTTKDAGHGTGLGLASAHRFVTSAGGCISVRTAPDQGTTVILCLPRATAQPTTIAPPRQPTPLPRGGTETILVVEDDEHVRRVVRTLLEEEGYTVLDASSGEAALGVAARNGTHVDLVLTDVVMPGMSGSKLAEKLHESGHGAKVLFMSGHTEDALDAHGALGTTYPLIRKAFSPSDLARKVREVLG